jgi:hypothetical protein
VKACEISEDNRLTEDELRGFTFSSEAASQTPPIFHHSASYSTRQATPNMNTEIVQS